MPVRKSPFTGPMLTILLAPIALAFIVAASLSGGPREVFRALANRDD